MRYGAPWVSGALVYGNADLGVLGSVIRATTSTGPNGPGILYNDWDSSADDGKAFRALIIIGAPAGTVFYEDGSFSVPAGTADGVYTVTYRLFVDGVDLGTSTATITIGSSAVNGTSSITLGAFTGSSAGAVTVTGSSSITLGAITGSFTGGGAAAINGVFDGAIGAFLGSASGQVAVSGSSAVTLGAITGSFSGRVQQPAINGYSSIAIGSITGSFSGSVSQGAATFTPSRFRTFAATPDGGLKQKATV